MLLTVHTLVVVVAVVVLVFYEHFPVTVPTFLRKDVGSEFMEVTRSDKLRTSPVTTDDV